jgi:predicted DNA-binding transcriptional regulator AlpA
MLLDEKRVAEFLKVTVHALRRWRFEKRGPQFIKLEGRLVRYRQEDISEWLRLQTVGGAQ